MKNHSKIKKHKNMKNSGVPKKQKPTLKIILVGSSGVGKTCLISSYFKQSFDFQCIPTVAPAYSCSDIKRTDGTVVSLQIWDTAGQERYHSVSKLFFRDSGIAFVCFEAGDEQSTSDVPNWIKRVKEETPTCKFFFVITKSDLHTPQEMEAIKKDAEIKLAEYEPKKIYITSALSREGVQELFNDAAELFQPKMQQRVPAQSAEPKQDKKKSCC